VILGLGSPPITAVLAREFERAALQRGSQQPIVTAVQEFSGGFDALLIAPFVSGGDFAPDALIVSRES
jgi:hypothetical protein